MVTAITTTSVCCCEGFKEGKTTCCGTGPFKAMNSCGGRKTVKEYQLCDNAQE